MFDRFGEMGSFMELNELAENLFNEGDLKSLKVMAKENGISEEYVDMYCEGETEQLCDALTAALGKIDIECEELKPKEIMADWVEYIKGQCLEYDEMALAVRKEGKSLKECIASLMTWSFKNQQPIRQDIIKAAGVNARKVTLGIPGMGRAKKIIREYYLGKL